MVFAVAVSRRLQNETPTTARGVCGILDISPHHRAVISNSHRLGGEEPERTTITTTGRHGIHNQATGSHSVERGLLYNACMVHSHSPREGVGLSTRKDTMPLRAVFQWLRSWATSIASCVSG
jgi:hypothetical protein